MPVATESTLASAGGVTADGDIGTSWPLVEALGVWLCVGTAKEAKLEPGSKQPLPPPSMSMLEFSTALSNEGATGGVAVQQTFFATDELGKLLRRGAREVTYVHSVATPDFRWLQLVPTMVKLGLQLEMPLRADEMTAEHAAQYVIRMTHTQTPHSTSSTRHMLHCASLTRQTTFSSRCTVRHLRVARYVTCSCGTSHAATVRHM
jgi:hypothetical protein